MSSDFDSGAPTELFITEDSPALLSQRGSASPAADRRPSSKPTVTDWPLLASSERASPRRFGDYELLEEIARGGMGVVFKARHVRLGGVVALKMILAGELASCNDVLRFHIEAEAASKLAHPNIVPIYEVGRVDGQHYFTMRLIEGKNLASRLDAGPLDPCLAAALLRDIALAVQHAHEHGVIHRDLKPDNILLDADGRPHITDFGVARRTYERSNLTDAGQVLGTPNYMSPEQAAGETSIIGPAADIYSLGAVLYTMLTGRPPFECHRIDILAQLMEHEPIMPRRLNLRIPPDLETICLKCLAKQPYKRYASAADLAADLNRFLANQPIRAKAACLAARASRWIRRQPRTAAAVALASGVVLLSLTGLAWQWRRAEQAQADATESRYGAHLAQAQANRWSGRAGGRFAAMAAVKKAASIRPSVALRNEAIACMTQFDLQVERTLEVGALLGMPDFSSGLDRLAYSDKQGTICVCDWPDGKTLCRLAAGRPSDALRQAVVRFSPDGSHLAAAMQYDAAHELSLWDLKRSRAVIRIAEGAHAMAIDFTPDGTMLAAGQPDGTLTLYQTSDGARISTRNLDLAPHAVRFCAGRFKLGRFSGERRMGAGFPKPRPAANLVAPRHGSGSSMEPRWRTAGNGLRRPLRLRLEQSDGRTALRTARTPTRSGARNLQSSGRPPRFAWPGRPDTNLERRDGNLAHAHAGIGDLVPR